jgi:hypothetical protein
MLLFIVSGFRLGELTDDVDDMVVFRCSLSGCWLFSLRVSPFFGNVKFLCRGDPTERTEDLLPRGLADVDPSNESKKR